MIISQFFHNKEEVFFDDDKVAFIVSLIRGHQLASSGFALRHVTSDEIFESNIRYGFRGDAVSYSITPHIMGLALDDKVSACFFFLSEENQASFIINNEIRPRNLDTALAVRIFDILHTKILEFVKLNFIGKSHHFMLIKNMPGAELPYDINDIYPTGKCGKRQINAKQIVNTFSKSSLLSSPEKIVRAFEKEIINLDRFAKHTYTSESTKAILSVLREIELRPNERALTCEGAKRRLISAEYQGDWSDHKYHSFYGKEGYFSLFKENLPNINKDLSHFRMLL